MIFTHDTEMVLGAAAALINTATRPDALTTLADVDALLEDYPTSGRVDRNEAELRELRELRGVLRGLWSEDEEAVVRLSNAILSDAGAVPRLVRHDAWDWHLHATGDDSPLAVRYAVETAMAMADVLRAGELARLRRCAAEDCDNVLVDLSRNRSRAYCDAGCGNRRNVAAYRARRRGARESA